MKTKVILIDPRVLHITTGVMDHKDQVAMERRNAGKDGRWMYSVLVLASVVGIVMQCCVAFQTIVGLFASGGLVGFSAKFLFYIKKKERRWDDKWSRLYAEYRGRCEGLRLNPTLRLEGLLEKVYSDLNEIADQITAIEDKVGLKWKLQRLDAIALTQVEPSADLAKAEVLRKKFSATFRKADDLLDYYFMDHLGIRERYMTFFEKARARADAKSEAR